MKTTKLMLAFSIALIFSLTGSLQAQSKIKTNPAVHNSPEPICYTVQIHCPDHLITSATSYIIYITDGFNRLIAPPQTFRPGLMYYDFYERGPVRGTRTAYMVPANELAFCVFRPASLSGYFWNNTCYLLVITAENKIMPATNHKD
jgi:hypothetical protein